MHAMPDHAEEDPPRFKPHDRVFITSSHPSPTLGGKYADVIEIKLDNISIEGKRENAYRYEVSISGSGRPAVVSERFLETAKKDQPLFSLGDHVRIKGFNYNGTITGHRRGESGGWIYTIRISTAQTTTAREVELELAESKWESTSSEGFKIGDHVRSNKTFGKVEGKRVGRIVGCGGKPDGNLFYRVRYGDAEREIDQSDLEPVERPVPSFQIGNWVRVASTVVKHGGFVGRVFYVGKSTVGSEDKFMYRVEIEGCNRGSWYFKEEDLELVDQPSEEKETICVAHLNDDMPAPDSGNSTAEAARHVLKNNVSPWARNTDKAPMAAREQFGRQSALTVGELRAFAQQGD